MSETIAIVSAPMLLVLSLGERLIRMLYALGWESIAIDDLQLIGGGLEKDNMLYNTVQLSHHFDVDAELAFKLSQRMTAVVFWSISNPDRKYINGTLLV